MNARQALVGADKVQHARSIPDDHKGLHLPACCQVRTTVVFLGADLFSLPLEALLARTDVDVRAVFAPAIPGCARVRALASGTTLISEPLDLNRHASLFDNLDMVLTAGYNHKIPKVSAKYPLNLHPSLLPEGRGPRPIPWILFDRPEIAGVTLHVLSEEFDAGPIIDSRPVTGSSTLSFEGYLMICNQLAVDLTLQFLKDPDRQFRSAKPQDVGMFPLLPNFPDHRRMIGPEMSGAEIVTIIKKLGPIGALLNVFGVQLNVTGAEFIPDSGRRPHKMFENNSLYSAMRCADGFVLIRPCDLRRINDKL